MSITTCPTDIVAASAEQIWDLLIQPEKLAAWAGARLIDGPNRELAAGDRVVLGPGFGMRVTIEVLGADKPRQLKVDAHLPFGVINHEVIQLSPLDDGRCRVTFN